LIPSGASELTVCYPQKPGSIARPSFDLPGVSSHSHQAKDKFISKTKKTEVIGAQTAEITFNPAWVELL